MQTAILTLHVIICLVLIILVLLQSGREGMGVIFGGGGNTSVFGSTGAGGILVKLTTFLAVLFIATSLGYNIITSSKRDEGSSILDIEFEEAAPAGESVPPAVAPADAVPPSTPVVEPTTQTEPTAQAEQATETEQAPEEAESQPETSSSPDMASPEGSAS